MAAYFKPLRRKLGVVMLLIACVFAAGWVRCLSIADIAEERGCQFQSLGGSLFCEFSPELFSFKFHFRSKKLSGVRDFYSHPSFDHIWRLRFCGFGYGSENAAVQNKDGSKLLCSVPRFNVPYWSIVMPLSLLSAWLLLSKPMATPPPENRAEFFATRYSLTTQKWVLGEQRVPGRFQSLSVKFVDHLLECCAPLWRKHHFVGALVIFDMHLGIIRMDECPRGWIIGIPFPTCILQFLQILFVFQLLHALSGEPCSREDVNASVAHFAPLRLSILLQK